MIEFNRVKTFKKAVTNLNMITSFEETKLNPRTCVQVCHDYTMIINEVKKFNSTTAAPSFLQTIYENISSN